MTIPSQEIVELKCYVKRMYHNGKRLIDCMTQCIIITIIDTSWIKINQLAIAIFTSIYNNKYEVYLDKLYNFKKGIYEILEEIDNHITNIRDYDYMTFMNYMKLNNDIMNGLIIDIQEIGYFNL
jgi:pyruvate/2-oxoacid:ferredoxin oxidoreductase beta subunit